MYKSVLQNSFTVLSAKYVLGTNSQYVKLHKKSQIVFGDEFLIKGPSTL